MKNHEIKMGIDMLVLERCDELEEMAIKMAREIAHLRAMLEYAGTQNNGAQTKSSFYITETEKRNNPSDYQE